MKQSLYNFFFDLENGEILAFNALKNGLAVIPRELMEKIKTLSTGGTFDGDEGLAAELQKGGFICPDNLDEYNLVRIRKYRSQYTTSALGLTIAPTLACNLACKYCFENPSEFIMDEGITTRLVSFVENYIKRGVQNVSVVWYGGEPLLALDVIESLSRRFMALCENKNVAYNASIITNGVLFTPETADRLAACKVNNAQITLDGDRDDHNQRRPYRGGQGSFDDIMANVQKSAGKIPMIIRCNIDAANSGAALDFLESIKEQSWFRDNYGKKLQFYFGHVRKYTASCLCSKDEVLKEGDFWEKDMELKNILEKAGFPAFDYPNITAGCCATMLHSYVVSPNGDLYKCWNHIGDKAKTVGSVFAPVDLNALHIEYLSESFEQDPECKKCKCLPACMGGCTDIRVMTQRGEMDHKDCSQWKYYLEESLRKFYTKSIREKTAKTAAV